MDLSHEAELFTTWNGLLTLSTALAYACFSVLSAVLASKLIINEYFGKNVIILFSYPIKRKVIFKVKCFIIYEITILSAFLSNTLVIGLMYVIAHYFNIELSIHINYFIPTVLFSSLLMGFLSSSVSIISTAFGWKKHSATATILFSILIICTTTNLIVISPNHLISILVVLTTIFSLIAYFIYRMLIHQVENMEV